jgi:hypothetical protein
LFKIKKKEPNKIVEECPFHHVAIRLSLLFSTSTSEIRVTDFHGKQQHTFGGREN